MIGSLKVGVSKCLSYFTNFRLATPSSHHKVGTFSKTNFNKRVSTPSGLDFSAAVGHHTLSGNQIKMHTINTQIRIKIKYKSQTPGKLGVLILHQTTFVTNRPNGSVDLHKLKVPYLLFPAAGLRPCWGQNRCQAHQYSRFRWQSLKCPGHPLAPSYLWFQTCAACRPGCPE